MEQLTRKEFLRRAAAAGLAGAGLGRRTWAAPAPVLTPVVLATSSRAVKDGQVVAEVAAALVHRAVGALVGKSGAAAWKQLFRPRDVVGIKVNCISGERLSSRPEVVAALVQGLRWAGVAPDHIIIFERTDRELRRAGFTLNKEPGTVQCLGVEGDHDPEPTVQGLFDGRLCRIISQRITALVNVPVPKDHDGAGVTFAMKNHYGSISNPGAHHRSGCAALADLNAVPAIRDKTRLILGDCLFGLAEGGPVALNVEAIWNENTIMATRDPVAADYLAWQMVDEARKRLAYPPLAKAGRPPRYIEAAAAAGLGTNDPAKMKVVRLTV